MKLARLRLHSGAPAFVDSRARSRGRPGSPLRDAGWDAQAPARTEAGRQLPAKGRPFQATRPRGEVFGGETIRPTRTLMDNADLENLKTFTSRLQFQDIIMGMNVPKLKEFRNRVTLSAIPSAPLV